MMCSGAKMKIFDKLNTLERVYKAIDTLTCFLLPCLPFVNSHLTEFYTENHWSNFLPHKIRRDLEEKTPAEVKQCLKDLVEGKWRNYACSKVEAVPCNFETASNLEELIVAVGRLQLSEMKLSSPGKKLWLNEKDPGKRIKFDEIMSSKKTHEVEVMSDFVKNISENVGESKIEYLVDLGSGKGYLSSFLTLLHEFKVLAVDSSCVNTFGCEKRSERLEKVWSQLVRRALEREKYGKCSKRGKNWKSKKNTSTTLKEPKDNESNIADGENDVIINSDKMTKETEGRTFDTHPTTSNEENRLLKTLTQFVTPDFDLSTSIGDNFPAADTQNLQFGIVGLHTCGTLGVDSLRLFISNENAKFICNVPCCYHLLAENHLFYPNRKFQGSKSVEREREADSKISNDLVHCILKPSFPVSNKMDENGSSTRFYLGRNAKMISAYSLHRMVASEKGLELHPSIFYRSVLQVLIQQFSGDEYFGLEDFERKVGKIGDKCHNFSEYVHLGLKNLQLDSKIQPTEREIEELYSQHCQHGKDQLLKYYLLRSLFASIIEGIILLDRLAYLLESGSVREAYIVELFEPSISPRCHACFAVKY